MPDASARLSGDDPVAAATVLLVDDNEHWAWATKTVLERNTRFTVEVAHSLTAGRERVVEVDPDCVVCDYDLGDGDGLSLLETVREIDSDLPFVLITGKGDETVASDAISGGVSDYLRKGQDNEDEILASRVRTLVRAYRTRRTLERQRRLNTAILDVLRETASETELRRTFCDRLVESDTCALAWIGTTTRNGAVLPRASAGRDGYLDAVLERGVVPADEPASIASDRGESVTASVDATTARDGWQTTADGFGFRSVAAVPIRYDNISFGVLAVYFRKPAADSPEATEIDEYAESIGYALQSLDRKRSLRSSQPVRVDIEVTDPEAPLAALGDRLPQPARVSSPSVVKRNDGTTVYLCTIPGVTRHAVESTATELSDVSLLDIEQRGETVKCTLAATGATPEEVLIDNGARFERTTVADGAATVSVHSREDKPLSHLSTAVANHFEDATVSKVWTDDRRDELTDNPFERLTDKQRTVLRHAFYEGYFERPREANATEIADRLGISRQTFAQHLRAAQRKIFETWQDGRDSS